MTIVTRRAKGKKFARATKEREGSARAPIHICAYSTRRSLPEICFRSREFLVREGPSMKFAPKFVRSCLSDENGRKASKLVESLERFRSSIKEAYTVNRAIELYEMFCAKKRRKMARSQLSDTSLFKQRKYSAAMKQWIRKHLDGARRGNETRRIIK